MTTREIQQGQVIFQSGQKINVLYLIVKGTASVVYPGGCYILHSGDVIGLCSAGCKVAYAEYRAEEKLTVIGYSFEPERIKEMIDGNSDAIRFFISSLFRQLKEIFGNYRRLKTECNELYDHFMISYQDYMRLCGKYNIVPGEPDGYKELERLSLERDMPPWMRGYYSALSQMISAWDVRKVENDFVSGMLLRASTDIHTVAVLCGQMDEYKKNICQIIMNEEGTNLLELLISLYGKAVQKEGPEAEDVTAIRRNMNEIMMRLEDQTIEKPVYGDEKAIYEKRIEEAGKQGERTRSTERIWGEELPDAGVLKDSLTAILSYAGCSEELNEAFRENVKNYKLSNNKNGTEDDMRLLRQKLTKEFYQIYIAAFKRSIKEGETPQIVKMLFNFGYVDEELAGIENARYLYSIVNHLPTAPERGVYSYYEWLRAVYEGKKEPSRNEFDLDYSGYLIEQRKTGNITRQEEKELLGDYTAKVIYELENVFPLTNKMTYGRVSTFCPVFSAHNVLKPLDSTLVSADKVELTFDNICQKDFGAYCREMLFTAPEQGIVREFLNIEVRPDVILTPNIGVRGVMWQEIEGKRRTTPARMLSSIFQMEDLTLILTRLTGEFRWEMCKRVQGARWNDLSERSLTSEYFDYIQFYRRNNELSAETKEKIKNDMGRARNSIKEMFVMDYVLWILYESNGSPRLNKVARTILFTYCSFSAAVREKLKINPLYRDLVERYDIRMGQKRHRMDNLCQKLRSMGKAIPVEIEREKQYLYK